MIGRIPKDMIMTSRNKYRYFTKNHKLKRANNLFKKTLYKHILEKYRLLPEATINVISFLKCFLTVKPVKRTEAQKMLLHQFMDLKKENLTCMNERQWNHFNSKQINLNLSYTTKIDYGSSSEISLADEEDNEEKDNEFRFNEITRRQNQLYFNTDSYRFNKLKRYCERDFLNQDVPVGYKDGIDIDFLDNPEFYNQFTDLSESKEAINE